MHMQCVILLTTQSTLEEISVEHTLVFLKEDCSLSNFNYLHVIALVVELYRERVRISYYIHNDYFYLLSYDLKIV